MSTATISELPLAESVEEIDDEETHWFCSDAPRNIPVATVMCCGLAGEDAGEEIWDESEPTCAVCVLAEEMGRCACWASTPPTGNSG